MNSPLQFANSPEFLLECAAVAEEFARDRCEGFRSDTDTGCQWYHGAWPYLRWAGSVTGASGEAGFFLETLKELARQGTFKQVLISGAADHALLAMVVDAYRSEGATPSITVLDRCATPLAVNGLYAGKADIEIRTIQQDILSFKPSEPFDLVFTHSIFSFVPVIDRGKVIATWRAALRPGGCVVTSQVIRPGYTGPDIRRFSLTEVAAYVEKFSRNLELYGYRDSRRILELQEKTRRFATNRRIHVVRDENLLRATFEQYGFDMRHFGFADRETQLSYNSASPESSRMLGRCQIVAAAM